MHTIHFTVNYEVNRKERFQHFLNAYSERVDKDLVGLHIARYDKFPRQWQATFNLTIPQISHADCVYEQLLLANALSTDTSGTWKVIGPLDQGGLSFECIFNTRKQNQPLRWAHLST